MHPALSVAAFRRRRWPWVVLALLLAPIAGLALAAYSFLTLDRHAAVLRREVMAAAPGGWDTKFQVSVGRITLGTARQALAWVTAPGVAEARLALRAVRNASVGVYRPAAAGRPIPADRLFHEADRRLRARGWTRLVAVAEGSRHVLVYLPNQDDEMPGRVGVAVCQGRELVVVSATLDPGALAELVARHAGARLHPFRGKPRDG
jgi:hypothetical protein